MFIDLKKLSSKAVMTSLFSLLLLSPFYTKLSQLKENSGVSLKCGRGGGGGELVRELVRSVRRVGVRIKGCCPFPLTKAYGEQTGVEWQLQGNLSPWSLVI